MDLIITHCLFNSATERPSPALQQGVVCLFMQLLHYGENYDVMECKVLAIHMACKRK